ncbi:MAG TPA: phosphoribosylamine--glycine ligase [Fibrobacteria bacterium]|nr:phosphoribosylamine--glycine ligase [Fibrobacteria bacterium]
MKILVIGSGGREHAIALKLSQSARRPALLFAPGNPGMAGLGTCHPVAADDVPGLLALALAEKPDLTVVGPEVPLVKGLVDVFEANGLTVFGPSAAAARLEGSKAFSKDFMARHGIPTAAFETFRDYEAARKYLDKTGAPVVVKASGLAAGKGAVVCLTMDEAYAALDSMLGPGAVFGEAGSEVVIEEFMEGEEASVFAVCDGERFALLPTAQDHKRAYDDDKGPNTGGMGAYSPAPIMTPALLEQTRREVIDPTLKGMRDEGCPYKGVLYVGLMLTSKGPKVVEYNCRLGDPETQCVLPIHDGDLAELFLGAAKGRIDAAAPGQVNGSAAVVVVASGGYPGAYKNGLRIEGIEAAERVTGVQVLHAGTRMKDGILETAGGRVLGVTGRGATLREALDAAYAGVDHVRFEGMHYRKDIGKKGLKG